MNAYRYSGSTPKRGEPTITCSHSMNEDAVKTEISFI